MDNLIKIGHFRQAECVYDETCSIQENTEKVKLDKLVESIKTRIEESSKKGMTYCLITEDDVMCKDLFSDEKEAILRTRQVEDMLRENEYKIGFGSFEDETDAGFVREVFVIRWSCRDKRDKKDKLDRDSEWNGLS